MSNRTNNQQKNVDDMSFMEHIVVLRWHLLRAAIVIAIFSIIAFFLRM
jgi:sec-independent protein translocase protein TatC